MDERNVAPLVARVSEVVAARLEQIAAETGVSYHTLYAWGRGRRHASPRHLARLATVVRRRARLLDELAQELEEQVARSEPVAKASARAPTAQAASNGVKPHAAPVLPRSNGARPTAGTP